MRLVQHRRFTAVCNAKISLFFHRKDVIIIDNQAQSSLGNHTLSHEFTRIYFWKCVTELFIAKFLVHRLPHSLVQKQGKWTMLNITLSRSWKMFSESAPYRGLLQLTWSFPGIQCLSKVAGRNTVHHGTVKMWLPPFEENHASSKPV